MTHSSFLTLLSLVWQYYRSPNVGLSNKYIDLYTASKLLQNDSYIESIIIKLPQKLGTHSTNFCSNTLDLDRVLKEKIFYLFYSLFLQADDLSSKNQGLYTNIDFQKEEEI